MMIFILKMYVKKIYSNIYARVCVCYLLSHVQLCDPMNCSLQASLPMGSPGKNTGVGCSSLLQGIFLTQGLNLGLLQCRQILYGLNHQGSPDLHCGH